MVTTWVYRLADGVFLRGGFYMPSFDPGTEGLAQFPDADPHPDIRLHRYDATLGKRLATPGELAATGSATLSLRSINTSREKDILSMCALVVRARGIAAWNAMTLPQKVTATLAEADVWKDMRIWAEGNL